MELWPAWMIASFLIGGPILAFAIWLIDTIIDELRQPKEQRWTPF